MIEKTPRELGFYFPAEWEKHKATWLSWPHNALSWPEGRLKSIFDSYSQFVAFISMAEEVCMNVQDLAAEKIARQLLLEAGADLSQITFYHHPTNDAWARDHGPSFLLHSKDRSKKAIINWKYNAWGGKYPYELDDKIPSLIAHELGLFTFHPRIVLEGGSVEFNGKGTVLTTKACLMHQNRNPHLTQEEIETILKDYFGLQQVLWLEDGIVGDDTDGHIDDLTRFVNEDTVVTVVESDPKSPNYAILQHNLKLLKEMTLFDGRPLNIIELPMPSPLYMDCGDPLPCSYANFYICNAGVVVPTFKDPKDETTLQILRAFFKDRPVIGIDSSEIIWGLGSFHCLSQQEPA